MHWEGILARHCCLPKIDSQEGFMEGVMDYSTTSAQADVSKILRAYSTECSPISAGVSLHLAASMTVAIYVVPDNALTEKAHLQKWLFCCYQFKGFKLECFGVNEI